MIEGKASVGPGTYESEAKFGQNGGFTIGEKRSQKVEFSLGPG